MAESILVESHIVGQARACPFCFHCWAVVVLGNLGGRWAGRQEVGCRVGIFVIFIESLHPC